MNRRFLKASYIELDETALRKNIDYLRGITSAGTRFSSVIKGNAYGHGISTFLPMAERCGIDHFSVYSADEAEAALHLSKNNHISIMIMGMIRDDEVEWAVENGVEFYVFEKGRLDAALRFARKRGKKARIHLQIETGMNRTGFEEQCWPELFERVAACRSQLELKGICTHYAGAESIANYYRIQHQNRQLQKAVELAGNYMQPLPDVHAASSAAFLTYPEMHYNMARIGIAHYGFWPSSETYMHVLKKSGKDFINPLKRVLSWKSEIMSTKWVKEGEFIGYGNTYMAGRNLRIATVPIGYTHGFGRNLTNSGYVLIHGERAEVVGIVNMNMITVDITNIKQAKKSDEVVIIGHQKGNEITVASFGEMSNNLNYEVLTRLPSSIPRSVKL